MVPPTTTPHPLRWQQEYEKFMAASIYMNSGTRPPVSSSPFGPEKYHSHRWCVHKSHSNLPTLCFDDRCFKFAPRPRPGRQFIRPSGRTKGG